PDMPAHAQRRFHLLGSLINRRVSFTQAVGPQHFPCEQFRIAKHEPPERDIVAIYRPLLSAARAHKLRQLEKARAGALHVDAPLLRLRLAELAKTSDTLRIRASMTGAQRIGKRALTLRSPHDAIDGMRPRPILHHAEQPV